MARKKESIGEKALAFRKKAGLNQKDFWTQFGVTQSGGSRYEGGRNVPGPLTKLLSLFFAGRVSTSDLKSA
jgi:transcriptional regulator with XRE-family HTH domain